MLIDSNEKDWPEDVPFDSFGPIRDMQCLEFGSWKQQFTEHELERARLLNGRSKSLGFVHKLDKCKVSVCRCAV